MPWGRHIFIFTHSKSVDKALFYVRKTVEGAWLICKSKDDTVVEWSFRGLDRPLGVASYEVEKAVSEAANSWWHPENWQTFYHIENWRIIHERPFVWGSFVWNMFDFGAAHRTEGDRPGINDKGLVSHDRRTRKDAFYFYKASRNA